MWHIVRKISFGYCSLLAVLLLTFAALYFRKDFLESLSRRVRELENGEPADTEASNNKAWKVSSILDMNVAPNIRKSFPKRASYYKRLEKKKKKKKKKKPKKVKKTLV